MSNAGTAAIDANVVSVAATGSRGEKTHDREQTRLPSLFLTVPEGAPYPNDIRPGAKPNRLHKGYAAR